MNANRLERARSLLREHGGGILALTGGATMRYVTGHPFPATDRLFLLLVPAQGPCAAVLPSFDVSGWRDIVSFECDVFGWDDTVGPARALEQAAARLPGAGRILVESLVFRYGEFRAVAQAFPGVEFGPADALVAALRMAKEREEIESIGEAARIAEISLEEVLPFARPGVQERELASRLCSALLLNGGEGISFGPIVLSGPKSAMPHGVPDGRELRTGELILFDFGTSVRGYHCDITRTFVTGALPPDDRTRDVYETVLAGNLSGCAAAKPGATAHEVHWAAQEGLHRPRFDGYLKHRTGHGLGLDVHESPSIMDGNHEALCPGTVFTVEPGLYLDGWGGVRIEDDVLITESSAEILTRFPRALRVVGG